MGSALAAFDAAVNAPQAPLAMDSGAPSKAPLPALPGQVFHPSVPPPTSPDIAAAENTIPATNAPQAPTEQSQNLGALAMFDAAANGPPQSLAYLPGKGMNAPQEVPDQSIPSMALNSLINGPFATVAAARNAANSVTNWGIGGINSLTGAHIPKFDTNLQPPLPVNPKTEGERMMVAGLENASGMIPQLGLLKGLAPLFKAGSMTANVLSEASKMPAAAWPSVVAGGAAGQLAADQVSDAYKGLAYFGGSLVGGLGQAGGQAIGEQAAGAAARTAGNLGMKMPFAEYPEYSAGLPEGAPGIKATPAQAAAAVQSVREAGGKNLEASMRNYDQNGGLPNEGQTLLQVAPGQEGVTNNLAAVDQTARKNANPEAEYGQAAFEAQRQQQNAAQIEAIRQLAPAAQPGALANLAMNEYQDRLKGLNEASEARVTEGAPNAAAFNPQGNVAARGEVVRSGMEAQRTAERQRVTNDFFNAIDPTGTAEHTMLPAKQMANILLGNTRIDLPPGAPPEMQAMARKLSEFAITPDTETHPAEMKMLNQIAAQPDTKPYLGTKTLLSNIQIAKNAVGPATGYTSPNMTRLRLLEGSLNDSMSTDLPQRIQAERAAPPDMNTMPLEEALQHYVTRQTAPQDQETVTRLYGPPPTVNPTAQTLQESRREWGRVADTYDTGPVGGMLAKTDYGRYATPEVSTALENAIGSGAGMPERTAKVIGAANGNPQILQAVQDHVVSKLGQLVTNPDGTLNVGKLRALQTRQHPVWQAVQQFPGVSERLNTAAGAQAELDATATRAADAYRQFGQSQLGKLLGNIGTPQAAVRGQTPFLKDPGEQVPIKVRAAIDMKDNGVTLKAMAREAQKNPEALQELRHQVIEQALNKFAPEAKAGAGMENATLDREGFRSLITSHKDAFRILYGGQWMQHLDRVMASLQQAERASKVAVNKAPTPLGMWATFARIGSRLGEVAGGAVTGGGIVEASHGSMAGIATAGVSAATAAYAVHLVKILREAGIRTKNDLVGAMMLHPQFYREMDRAFPPTPKGGEVMLQRLSTSLRAITQSQLAGSMPAVPKQ